MKHIPCLVCDDERATTLLINTRDPFGPLIGSNQTRYVTCDGCGFVYQNPTLETHEIESLYSRDYYDKQDQVVSEGYKRKKDEYAGHSFDWISEQLPVTTPSAGATILDIGCNTGAFLARFVRAGWEGYGVEASTNMTDIARNEYGLENIQTKLFETGDFEPDAFDFVALLHTLEHLEYPEKILSDIRDVLRPDGHLYIEVPNIYHPKSAFYTSYFAAPHLYVFSPRSLERYLAKQGFKTVAAGRVPRGICVLAQIADPHMVDHHDAPEEIHELIAAYKQQHDKDAFLHTHVANSIPARVLIKLHIPWVSRMLSRWREKVRVNKII